MRALLLVAALAPAAAGQAYRVESVEGGTLTSRGATLAAGAELSTTTVLKLDAGRAVIALGGEGKVLLRGPGELRLGDRRLELTRGALLSVLPRLKARLWVATPLAVAAVRGTDFYLDAREDGRTYLCLCAGTLEVSGAPGLALRWTKHESDKHLGHIYSRHGKRVDRNPWPMEGHDDADIKALKD